MNRGGPRPDAWLTAELLGHPMPFSPDSARFASAVQFNSSWRPVANRADHRGVSPTTSPNATKRWRSSQ
jgi:hypothetical protein